MKRTLLITALAILCAATSCKEQNTTPANGSRIGFALSFFRNANYTVPQNENLIISPYSAGVALSMLEAGAQEQTKVEFDNALNGTFYKSEDLGTDGSLIAKSANSIWISNDFSVRNKYVETLEKDFDAFVGNYDFSDPSVVKEINDWCSEHTNGKITEIVDRLSPDMVMLLVNALYFNAPWEDAFNPKLTHDGVFHGLDGDRKVPMMFRKAFYEYAEYQGFQIVGIPYKGERYSMYIVLPPSGMDINEAIPYMNEQIYYAAMGMLVDKEVSLTMPKLRLTSSLLLNETLRRMGVKSAFGSAADFRNISVSGKIQLDVVKQKCYIDVNEKGTEAAAVTSSQIRTTALRPETIMNVDRPFVFMIADRENETVLFAGKIVNMK